MESKETDLCDVGVYGLAVMGQNFALNIASHGFRVAVSNRSPDKVEITVQRAVSEGNLPLVGSKNVAEFVKSLKTPRKVIMLIQAGKPVDDTIEVLAAFMEAGDILVDGGNEWFPNSIRRSESLTVRGIMYVGMGISGGEEGARNGPSLMPGGPKIAYDILEPILSKCAAQVGEYPCVTYLGPIGSGNYVKMVHNGIEYGDMQLIAEIYDVLKNLAGLTNEELAVTFADWNKTELESYLVDITAQIMNFRDDMGDGYLIDKILDKTGMKGTGRWTVQEAAERSVAAPTIAAALDARYLSARKEDRVQAAAALQGPTEIPGVEKSQIVEDCKDALFAAKVCSYAQGMSQLKEASCQLGWDINLGECARIWRGGCIIRAAFLDNVAAAFTANPDLPNLLLAPWFTADINRRQNGWRRIVTLAIASGISCPALSASISYYDTFRRAKLPANLTQAQRDFFGGHSFERVDRAGSFHAHWTGAHADIGDVAARLRGEL